MKKTNIDTLIQDVLDQEINKRYNFLYESMNKKVEKDIEESEEDLDEEDTNEGNKFSYELKKAKEKGEKEFEVDGKKYPVKESKKWIQDVGMKKNELHKKLGIPEDEKIPKSKLNSIKKDLEKKAEGDKKLSKSDLKLLKQVNLALKLKSLKETVELTESELIDLIENIIIEEKNNITKSTPQGLQYTEKAQKGSKKENDDYIKSVTEKMKKYLTDGSKGDFDMNPKTFPKGNGELGEMKKKAYKASDAVEEYIENFAYAAGLDELAYDEIEHKEEWVKKNIVGDKTTGNDPKYANAVETDLGEKIFKKSKLKPYTTEKRKGSYKRQPQPIDTAGEDKGKKSIDDMFTKLESTENKKDVLISEEMNKMKSLISYDRKTQ